MRNKLTILVILLTLLTLFICSCQDTKDINNEEKDGHPWESETIDNNYSESDTSAASESAVESDSELKAEEPCQHSFSEWEIIKIVTCSEEGEAIRICSKCSESEKKTIQKSDDHIEITTTAIAATCKSTGLSAGSSCSVCGKVLVAQTIIPVTNNHTPVKDASVAATCRSAGLTEGSHCGVCGKVLEKQAEISQKQHNYIDGYCEFCREGKVSSGLKFEDCDGYAAVSGIGSCTDTVIIIPETSPSGKPVKEIAMAAFQNCDSIVEVIVPDDVVCIGSEAFLNCTALEKITLPSAYEDMQLRTFKNCTSLKEITIPNGVFRIGAECFANCTSLESIVIPISVNTYSKDAFKDCTIKNLYISSLDVWCDSKFNNFHANPLYCAENLYLQQTLVTDVEMNKNIPFGAFAGYEKLNKVVLGSAVTSIGDSAFYGCSGLTQVIFGNSIETIGAAAFYDCAKVNELYLPSSLKTISTKAFYGCSALQAVTVANGLQSLGDYAFGGCSALRAIDLPSTITYMGISSFEKCASLESITIPFVGVSTCEGPYEAFGSLFGDAEYEGGEMITQILHQLGTQVFEYSYCIPKSLKYVKVLSRDEYSSNREFVNCKYIESITFGKNVTRVGASSIVGCTALTNIYYEGTKEEWKNLRYSESFNSINTLTVTCSDGVVQRS